MDGLRKNLLARSRLPLQQNRDIAYLRRFVRPAQQWHHRPRTGDESQFLESFPKFAIRRFPGRGAPPTPVLFRSG